MPQIVQAQVADIDLATGAPDGPCDHGAIHTRLDRLKALYDGFHYRELARMLFIKFGQAIDHKTVKVIWQASAVSMQGQLALMDYHAHPARYQARLQVIRLYYQGWAKVSIMRVLQVSRPTVNAWIRRFEAEHFAGLVDKPRGPKHPRPVWLPLLEQVHQAFIHTYNTTAHQGLLKDRRDPPIPVAVLGTAKGRVYPQDELARAFSQGLFPRITNRHGCVTVHSYHFYLEEGLPHTRVLLWVSGESLRAAFESVVLAEYRCRYDW
jgi:Winged helix-turn helix